jgi:hypothetical protein
MSYGDMWTYRSEAGFDDEPTRADIVGFSVKALDGSVGKIDATSFDVGSTHLVVATRPWIYGQKVIIPAGTVKRVDFVNQTVHVNRTKNQMKHAPAFDEATYRNAGYGQDLWSYYGPEGRGYQNW